MVILASILTLAGLGIFFGIGLAVASKKFFVATDPRLEEITGKLPGANCGACGMPGCLGFAEALINGKAMPQGCLVAKEEARKEIARILGLKEDWKEKTKTIATLHCFGGNKRAKDKFLYSGIEDCLTASMVMGGQKACVYGCLGFSSCVKVCPFEAIAISSEGLPVVDRYKCKACNKCVQVCPKKLFELIPEKQNVFIACNSHDLGKDTRLVCSVGCIACRKCEQVCPAKAITILDNLAVIDYNKCTSCGECVKVCPMKTIRIRE